jgi:hypothetical protein
METTLRSQTLLLAVSASDPALLSQPEPSPERFRASLAEAGVSD